MASGRCSPLGRGSNMWMTSWWLAACAYVACAASPSTTSTAPAQQGHSRSTSKHSNRGRSAVRATAHTDARRRRRRRRRFDVGPMRVLTNPPATAANSRYKDDALPPPDPCACFTPIFRDRATSQLLVQEYCAGGDAKVASLTAHLTPARRRKQRAALCYSTTRRVPDSRLDCGSAGSARLAIDLRYQQRTVTVRPAHTK